MAMRPGRTGGLRRKDTDRRKTPDDLLNRCENVQIVGITVQNSPSWNIHPYFPDI